MERFDYIVIGAGSAGCVVAERLSSDDRCSVLLLEAGPEDTDPRIADPAAWAELAGSPVDWSYQTEPQQHAAGRRIRWPRGRVLGGSSSINALVHMRGAAADYDTWAQAGATGWDYESVLPDFIALEDFDGGDAGYHGQGGPMGVSLPREVNPLSEATLQAATDLGFPINDDFNGKALDGVGWNQLAVRHGVRQSAAVAFLRPALGRSNLTVTTGVVVHRLVLDGERVQGVEYVRDSATHVAEADAEVIVCAGTMESPKLLMLSGIGHPNALARVGISTTVAIPQVGANLHDHPGIGTTFHAKRVIPPGPNQNSELGMFARLDPAASKPQLQYGMIHVPYFAEGYHAPDNSFTFYPSWTTPLSRGHLTLRSADPADPPVIDPAYLSHPDDLTGLMAAVELSRELARAPSLADWTDVEVVPGPGVEGDDLRDYIRRAVDTWFHPSAHAAWDPTTTLWSTPTCGCAG